MARTVPASTVILLLLLPWPAPAQDIAAYYDEHCAACHTIGGGAQAGPDLKDVGKHRSREWLVRFLVDPEGFVSRGDPIAVHLVEEWQGIVMPATPGLTPAVAEALLAHIERQSAGGPAVVAERPVTAADGALGAEFFTGARRFERGGPPCLGCHELASIGDVRGGSLGPDLTTAHQRLGGQRGLAAWLSAPPTPMMRALYRSAAMTDDERHVVAAVLGGTPEALPSARPAGVRSIAIAALEGAVLLLALAGFVWRRRFRAVRRQLLESTQVSPPLRAGGPR
jgi:cytochrome c2